MAVPSSIDIHFPELTHVHRPVVAWHSSRGVPPHITLLFPWVDEVASAHMQKVSEIADATLSFDIVFTDVRTFEVSPP